MYEYGKKDNRNNKMDLNDSEMIILNNICYQIETALNVESNKKEVVTLMEIIEKRIIALL